MQQTKTLYQKTAIGKLMVWTITQKDDVLEYEWGYSDSDKWQKTEEKIKSINESTIAHKTPTENAAIVFTRKLQKRRDSGYFETQEEAEKSSLTFDFDNLPKSFSPNKPVVSKPCLDKKDINKCNLPNKAVETLIKENRFWAQRKANGCRCFYVKSENKSYLYSRKIKNVEENFIGLKEKLDELDIPPFSIIDLEAVIGGGYAMNQYLCISSMSPNTKPQRSKEIYNEWLNNHSEEEQIGAIVFDVVFWNSQPVIYSQYKERYELIETFCKNTDQEWNNSKNKIVRPYNYIDFKEATKEMKDGNWEGLIVWDNELYSDYNLNGKPKRPKGCYKWKNSRTADCFVIEVIPQEGNDKLAGSLNVGQFNSTGDVIDCGNVGSGLTDETRLEAWDWKNKVISIEFNERLEPNDEGQVCFLFPRILELRKDKSKDECIFEEDEQ